MVAALVVTVATQPLIASPPAFRDPANAKTILGALDVLAVMPHTFYEAKGPASASPAMARLYTGQINRAKADYLRGNFTSARERMRTITGMCLGCHLRRPNAPKFDEAAQLVDSLKLEPLERANYYAATRQFDRALALWRTSLKEAGTDAEAYEHSQALRVALDVAVRAKDDPRAAMALIESQDERDDYSEVVTDQLELARREVAAWDAEHFSAAKATTDQLMDRARTLIERSGAMSSPAADDRHFISLLRAAAYLDEALQREPNAPWRGEALYLLGVVSTSVNDPLLWQLETIYLEACIRENPMTSLSKQCWSRLSSRMWFSYAGWADIPAEDAGWLSELRRLVP